MTISVQFSLTISRLVRPVLPRSARAGLHPRNSARVDAYVSIPMDVAGVAPPQIDGAV